MGRHRARSKNSYRTVSEAKNIGDRGRPEANEIVAERPGQQVLPNASGDSVDDIKVHVLVPAREQVHGWFAYSLALALTYVAYNHPYVKTKLVFNNGTVLSSQRTELAQIAMLEGADWTIWFDTDMRFPSDTIERLLAHNKPIVMAGYPTRKPPAIEPTTYADYETQERVYTEHSSTGLQEIASGGFGCVAVHRSVFEAMPPPWFHIPWHEKEMRFECGEDIYFCRKAKETGFKIYLDHDLSKDIAHIGNYEFTYREALAVRPKIEELRHTRIKL